jgi:hypothetical protein
VRAVAGATGQCPRYRQYARERSESRRKWHAAIDLTGDPPRERSLPTRRDERTVFGEILGLDEHLGKSRMHIVSGRRRQDHFSIGCKLNLTREDLGFDLETRKRIPPWNRNQRRTVRV